MLSIASDTDAFLNLAATGQAPEIARALDAQWLLVPQVVAEARFIEAVPPAGRIPLSAIVADLVASGMAALVELDASELTTMVRLAARLGDGESASGAVALHRGHTLATDDRLARRVLSAEGVSLTSTPELMHRWASTGIPGDQEVARALRAIEQASHFWPGSTHPLAPWWRAASKGGG